MSTDRISAPELAQVVKNHVESDGTSASDLATVNFAITLYDTLLTEEIDTDLTDAEAHQLLEDVSPALTMDGLEDLEVVE